MRSVRDIVPHITDINDTSVRDFNAVWEDAEQCLIGVVGRLDDLDRCGRERVLHEREHAR